MSYKMFPVLSVFMTLVLFSASPLLAADDVMPQQGPAVAQEAPSLPFSDQPADAEDPAAAAPAAPSAPDTAVTVGEVVICRDVLDRNPVGEGTLFASDVGRLFCHSLILGAEEETIIHHVWYWNDQKMADVPLTVRSPRFRTHSSKKILPDWKGAWRVELLGPEGQILSTAAFNVE